MYLFSRYVSAFTLVALGLVAATSGCTEINAAMDCEQLCEQLEVCVDSSLKVGRCTNRCEDKADDDRWRRLLDDCTDCLDRDYACAEVPERCSACEIVAEELL